MNVYRTPRRKSCFLRIPSFFASHLKLTPMTAPSTTHIPSYLFYFHSLARFCLNSMDSRTDGRTEWQTNLSHVIVWKSSAKQKRRRRIEICCLCLGHTTDNTRQDCLALPCFVLATRQYMFSVVLRAFRDWKKQFRNFLSPTVLTYRHLNSVKTAGTDKTRQDNLFLFLSVLQIQNKWKV